ncbi:Beta-glucuronidase [Pseudocercospora fuligena]|uniref:Beta-glucuronidase n=1 Tax=Pseudocercospora fuligena TaxID=685502 RepID=A0A8H6RGQ7_9PEZI|nr:Beta-glucuronidase [Pseudocercospora fuligena]
MPFRHLARSEQELPALAFEVSSFYSHAIDENGKPNEFSKNLINAIFSRTGGPPILRVGGTSGDHGRYNASLKTAVSHPATEGGPRFKKPYLQVGPSYFKAYDSFPNAKFVFMVPLEHSNIENSLAWAEKGLAVIGSRLDALESGNEPDFYGGFTIPGYIKKYNAMREALVKKFPKQLGGTIFQAIDKAFNPPTPLPIDQVQGPLNTTGAIKQYAYHYYQHWGKYSRDILQSKILNHTKTVNWMKVFAKKARYLRYEHPTVPFLMDEVGVSMTPGEGHNNLATALWNADYLLHCMSIDVTRVHMQQIVAPGFNMWEPVKSIWGPPLVRPNFYGMVFAADFIGRNPTRVHGMDLDGDFVAGYTAWENGKVARIALFNLNMWYGGGNRPSITFNIKGLPDAVKSGKVNYLSAPTGAEANTTVTWSGLQWTYASGGKAKQVKNDAKTINVKNGVLSVAVDHSSAVIIDV